MPSWHKPLPTCHPTFLEEVGFDFCICAAEASTWALTFE